MCACMWFIVKAVLLTFKSSLEYGTSYASLWFIVKAVLLTFKSSLEYGTSYASLFLLLPNDFPYRAITDVLHCTVLCQPKEYNDTHVCCWDCMYISFLTSSCWSCMERCHTHTNRCTHSEWYTCVAGTACTSAFSPCLAGVAWSSVTCWVEFWCFSSFDVGQMTESFCWFCLKRVSAKKET